MVLLALRCAGVADYTSFGAISCSDHFARQSLTIQQLESTDWMVVKAILCNDSGTLPQAQGTAASTACRSADCATENARHKTAESSAGR